MHTIQILCHSRWSNGKGSLVIPKTNKTCETGVPFVTQVENIRQWPSNGRQRTSPLKVQSKVQPEEYIDLYSDIFNCSYYNASPPSQG